MGMLIDGRWTEEDRHFDQGRFKREKSVFADEMTQELADQAVAQPGRFVLIASASCPWSHRCVLVRTVKGLEELLPMHLAFGPRVEGYAVNGGSEWRVPGRDLLIRHLHELYSLTDHRYTGRSTVPVLWDSAAGRIISNESMKIVQFMDRMKGGLDLVMFPEKDREALAALQAGLHEKLNNGVYRAGFAREQQAYEEGVQDVFSMLDELEERLENQPYLMGRAVTFADWQAFPTLVRFDAIYYILHRCCRKRLVDYPNLWDYARRLYQWPGVAETVDWTVMLEASYRNDTDHRGTGIIPVLPEADWLAPVKGCIGEAA